MGRQRNSRKTEKPNPPADEVQNPNVAPVDASNEAPQETVESLASKQTDGNEAPIESSETKRAMLTTESMPGGTQDDPQKPLFILPPQKQPEATQPRLYTDKDLGKCVRTVSLRRGAAAERQVMHLTFKPNCVYELVLIRGRAKVPQEIAVYIQKNNPGGNLTVN